ncbi:recombinase family protein [Microbacterium sp. zg.Y1090]|uniref:recombinase family protein n=1 Tax=Microbacterium wangruii TaxID=3049073 RepID=UPI00214DE0CF|nr:MULTISPECIES: recombinase family protein [unclassified Microbacterium]MCR2819060.1 recombinase family protein [Microbacterium sp. zg.Y1090]WIM27363.1 recombinase family protein [Microbacterium sp. zg-Y1090]
MSKPRAAAIYARISSDPSGQALGVQRQLEDCRKLAAERGWPVADEYVDNDVSAYSGKRRPEYERMLADVRDGMRDAVIVYNMDRLTRRPIELEEFTAVSQRAGLRHVATATTDVDLGSDDGLFMARITAAVAAKESARKSERVRRKMQQNAERGLPGGGANRPYGYEEDKVTVNPAEAAIVREIVGRYIAGESARAIAEDLRERGVPTATGVEWRSTTIRGILLSPRIAGLRAHRGEIVGKAVWDPIISIEQRQQVLNTLEQKQSSGRRAPRRYLLSGLLRCGKCGGKLFAAARVNERRYVCSSGPDHRGCGGIMVNAARAEEWIAAAVLYRLDTPEMEAVLTGKHAQDDRYVDLAAQREKLQDRMRALAEMFSEGQISPFEWKAARDPLEAQLTGVDQQLSRLSASTNLDRLVGNGAALQAGWEQMTLERQAAIVRSVLDYATVLPATSNRFDPGRIQPMWVL